MYSTGIQKDYKQLTKKRISKRTQKIDTSKQTIKGEACTHANKKMRMEFLKVLFLGLS